MNILITGGAGFIGSAVIRHIINNTNDSVVNVDTLEQVFAKYQPDLVMHLAAESHVDRSIDSAENFIQTNIVGTYTLLEVARQYWQRFGRNGRFIH